MSPDDLRALLALLTDRGTAAWVLDRPGRPAPELVVDHSGLDSVVRALVGRGFTADVGELPARIDCRHPRLGAVTIRPCTFDASGAAYGYDDDGPLLLPADAFDPIDHPFRSVRPTDGADR
ncbi:hypothetical protein [Egicoccus sp. AB-alg2]|uniref:hypothetical protein n=1 Tax=Egicoccus sp. AB-alg2 TaxID=3242693 RepID=UPI00359D6627